MSSLPSRLVGGTPGTYIIAWKPVTETVVATHRVDSSVALLGRMGSAAVHASRFLLEAVSGEMPIPGTISATRDVWVLIEGADCPAYLDFVFVEHLSANLLGRLYQ